MRESTQTLSGQIASSFLHPLALRTLTEGGCGPSTVLSPGEKDTHWSVRREMPVFRAGPAGTATHVGTCEHSWRFPGGSWRLPWAPAQRLGVGAQRLGRGG